MPRKKEYAKGHIGFRVPLSIKGKLQEIADEDERSVGFIVLSACKKFLENHEATSPVQQK